MNLKYEGAAPKLQPLGSHDWVWPPTPSQYYGLREDFSLFRLICYHKLTSAIGKINKMWYIDLSYFRIALDD